MKSFLVSKLEIETDRQAKLWLALTGVICMLTFLATIPLPRVDNHLIGSDGLSYYAITRSIVLDRDLDFTNDYKLLGVNASLTTTGLPANQFAIGTALLWMPFFFLAHVISVALNVIGLVVPLNGVSYIYEASVCLSTIAFATFGFILTYHTIRKANVGDIIPSFWSVIAMWLATPAIYYITVEPSMSHGLTIFTISVFFFTWYKPSPNRLIGDWVKIGLATGLVALGRWQDGIIILVPLAEICWWLLQRKLDIAQGVYYLLAFSIAVFFVFLPQVVMWKILYAMFLTIPQGNDFFSWTNPQILPTLFSTRHGLVSWHPIFLLAIVGLIPLWKKNRAITLVVVFMFAGELFVNSAASRWWADDAFGGRRFISLIPLLAVPLTAILTKIRQVGVITILVILIAWNALSLVQYRLGFVSVSEALTIREMTIDRLLLPFELARRFLR